MKRIIVSLIFILTTAAVFGEDLKLIKFADSLYNNGDYYRAISEYKRYIFYNDTGEFAKNASYKIGMSYMMAGKFDEAADAFDKVSLDNNGELKFLSLLSESVSVAMKKDYTYSSAVASKVLNDPEGSKYMDKARYVTGFNLINQGEYSKAMVEFGDIKDPELAKSSASVNALLNKSGEIPTRSPVISGLLSIIIPGSGHVYCGRWTDGIVSFVVNSFFIYNVYGAFKRNDTIQKYSFGIPGGVIYLSSIYGGVVSANKFNDEEVVKFKKSAEEYKVEIIKTEF